MDQSVLLLDDLKRAVARLESVNGVMLPMVRALYDKFIVQPAAKRRRIHTVSFVKSVHRKKSRVMQMRE